MLAGNPLGIPLGVSLIPDDRPQVVPFAKNLLADLLQVGDLMFVHVDENGAVLRQQVPGQLQPRVYHIQPVRMEPAAALVVPAQVKQQIPLRIVLPAGLGKGAVSHGEVVMIDEAVPAGVIGRIDIDHLHFAQIGFPQQLEHIQIIPLDIEVLCAVKIHALLEAGAQSHGRRSIREQNGAFLARPGELIPLLPFLKDGRKLLAEHSKIYAVFHGAVFPLPLYQAAGEQLSQLFYIFFCFSDRTHSQPVHLCSSEKIAQRDGVDIFRPPLFREKGKPLQPADIIKIRILCPPVINDLKICSNFFCKPGN